MGFKKERKIILSIILFILMWVCVVFIKNYFSPLIWILILTFLMNPIFKLVKKSGINRRLSAAIVIGIFNITLGLILYYLGSNIIEIINTIINKNIEILREVNSEINRLISSFIGEIDLNSKFLGLLNVNTISRGFLLTGDSLMSYVIGNIGSFFLLSDRDLFVDFFKGILSKGFYNKISKETDNIKEVVNIQIIIVLTSTLITMTGFLLLGIPDTIFLGVICGILDILPYVGTIIVFVPIIIYNIIVKDYLIVIGLILLYILVQIVREILEAKLLSKKFNLHPLVILISIYIGIKIFGVTGAIIGPIYCMMSRDILIEDEM